jgi:hypothetical protein
VGDSEGQRADWESSPMAPPPTYPKVAIPVTSLRVTFPKLEAFAIGHDETESGGNA